MSDQVETDAVSLIKEKQKKFAKRKPITHFYITSYQKFLLKQNQGIQAAKKIEDCQKYAEKEKTYEITKSKPYFKPEKFRGNRLGEKHSGRYFANSNKTATPSRKLDPRIKSSAPKNNKAKWSMNREVHLNNVFGNFDNTAYYKFIRQSKK